jgi:hypothetical protein
MEQTRMFVGFGSTPKEAFLDAHVVTDKKMGAVEWVINDAYFTVLEPLKQTHVICNLTARYGD